MTTQAWSPEATRIPAQKTTSSLDTKPAPKSLMADQYEMLHLLANGLSDQAIGRRLGMSRRTVQRRVRSLMDYFGVQTRFQLGMRAARKLTTLG
ncbi:MAG TPA: helix-turn-helix domain-containing protein [Candidatus Stackebrandtia faecavium]|nr:helix-turn-helix domain-containing protein [Candidatus Stackebrandtia faecavium]